MAKNSSQSIIDMMEDWFKKAPALPTNVREILVKITPIIALVFGVLGVLGGLGGLGLLTMFSPLAALGGASQLQSYGSGFVVALCLLISSVLMLMAYPGTKAHKYKGWELLFWSEVVSLVSSVISLNIVSGLIGALIGFYLLFQIKSYYK